MKHLVTGGAGFIGSHLVDLLVAEGEDVVVLDNFITGNREFLGESAPRITLIEGDASDADTLDAALAGVDMVWHLAANPEVRSGEADPQSHYDSNVAMTWALLQAMRRNDVTRIGFTSTSTVYGTASVRPTPEDYGPLLPISIYGGAKLACEALISSFAGTFGFDALLFRFANVVGPRSNHGVTFDFVRKLRKNPNALEILGDGSQTKSYVHVADTVRAMVHASRHAPPGVHAFNVGSLDGIPVTAVADIVSTAMGLSPTYSFTGGADVGGAGWKGDVKHMGLAIEAMMAFGWTPEMTSAQAVEATAQWLVQNA